MSDGSAPERRRTADAVLLEILEEQRGTRTDVANLRDAINKRELYQRLADEKIENVRIQVEGKDGDGGLKEEVTQMRTKLYMAAGAVAVILWGLDHLFTK